MIQLKRAYESTEKSDGARFLVERLWPRGVKKEALSLHAWLKEVAPSSELRKWFSHDPAKWPEFQRRYLVELRHHTDPIQPILDAARSSGPVTLIYSSHDASHNNAVVLKAFVEHLLAAPRSARKQKAS